MSTNFFIVVTIILLILLFAAYGLLMWYMFNRIRQQDKIIDLSSYEINTRNPIDQSIPSALDSFISDCFTDYQLMVLIPRNELYITEVREQEIIKDLAAKVSERISPNFKERLSKKDIVAFYLKSWRFDPVNYGAPKDNNVFYIGIEAIYAFKGKS